MPKSHLTMRKQHKISGYRGVDKVKNGWITNITINKKKYVYGPFQSEEDAAKCYDEKALENFKENAVLNILPSPYPPHKEIVKNVRKRKRNMKETIYNRVKFSIVTKNKICSKQKWCCNFCKNLLTDIFIVDHIIPLFLGGSNEEYNLQALCPSCDRYKTSQLDFQVIKPLSEIKQITTLDVLNIQKLNYHKMMCIESSELSREDNKRIELNINGVNIIIQS